MGDFINWRIHSLTLTASTNDDARRAAEAGEPEGLVIVAERQSAGRGRQGRVWESPAGNLHCSVLLRPKDMPHCAALYTFVAALAVREVVAAFLPQADILLKWPNDVLVEGKKISGILLEVAGNALIVGIGINVAHYPENTIYPATSLIHEGAMWGCDNVLHRLLDHLAHWHTVMQNEGFEPARSAWLRHAKKGQLTVRLPQGTLEGEFAGLNQTGHLLLRLADGTERAISTGDVVQGAT